jgi:pimeloyl-ACP methyl ester carboxylesterase
VDRSLSFVEPSGGAGRLAVRVEGDATAPLVVLQHGFPDLPSSFDAVAAELRRAGYRTAQPYLRGWAPSPLEGPFDFARLGLDLCELAEALSPDRPALLVGHDWGAVAGWVALAVEPGRFRRAALLSVPHLLALRRNVLRHPRQLRRSWYMGFFQLRGVAERALRARDHALIARLWRDWSPGFAVPPEHLAAVASCLDESLPAPIAPYRAIRLRNPELERSSRRLDTPVLYLHGAGHFVQLERPDVVARRCVEWFGR